MPRHSPHPAVGDVHLTGVSGQMPAKLPYWQESKPMTTNMRPLWQRTFLAFAGSGIHHPSETMRVSDGEAADLLAGMAGTAWGKPLPVEGRHPGYSLRHAPEGSLTALFYGTAMVGFYAGSYLWIAGEHRGRRLSVPLILAAAEARGGTVLPPGISVQGYTVAGLAAHRAAYQQMLLRALTGRTAAAVADASPATMEMPAPWACA